MMENSCRNIQGLMPELVNGTLSDDKAHAIRRHISQCRACSEYLHALQDDDRLLGEFAETMQSTVTRLQDNVSDALSRATASKPVSTISTRRIVMERKIVKLAAAAVIVIGLFVAVIVFTRPAEESHIPGTATDHDGKVPARTHATKLATELSLIEQMAADGDVTGLVAMLSQADLEFQSKVAVANYLAEIGDLNSVPTLEELDNEYGTSEPAFAEAIDAIEEREATAGAPDTNAPSEPEDTAVVAGAGVPEQAVGELLQLVPAESLFCVRVNNFDYTFGMVDQFLAGLSPVPAAVTVMARTQLAGMLGDPALSGVTTTGNFALFGLALGDESGGTAIENMFIGVLVALPDFAQFVSDNTNCAEPDANGVCVIKTGGTVDPDKETLVAQVGAYALVPLAGDYDRLVSVARSILTGAPGLGGSLDPGETRAATSEPIWAYCNIQRASKVFGPILETRLEEMRKQLERMQANQQGVAPAAVMNMYFGMLDIVMKEVRFVSLCVNPKPDILNLTVSVGAVPQTYVAKMFVADTSGEQNRLLGYLQDGAIANLGGKMNTPFFEELNLSQFDVLSFLDEEGISEQTVARVEQIVADMIASCGGPGIMSYRLAKQGWPPFAVRYVVDIEDPNRWNEVTESAMTLWNTGGFADIYRKLGVENRLELNRRAYDYNGVYVDSGKYLMRATDTNSFYGAMMEKMYRGGFDYRCAMVNGLWLCVVGADCDSDIRGLIDQVRAGGPKELTPEVSSAFALLKDAANADFVGTGNLARYLSLAVVMAGTMQGIDTGDPALLQMDVPTSSNIAFAGKVYNGKMAVEIALPKGHVLETKAAAELMQQKMMEIASRQEAFSQITAAAGLQPGAPADSNLMGVIDVFNEETTIEGLRYFAQISNGRYPRSLVATTAIEEAGYAFRKSLLDDPNTDPNTPPAEEDLRKFMNIEAACLFYAKLVEDGNDVAYYGDTVTSQFPHAVLMRWKISGQEYKVIHGDLFTQIIPAEQLAGLESLPLNRTAKAIQPQPADGAMARTLTDLRLTWTPGMTAAEHRVYFGPSPDELSLLDRVTAPTWDKPPQMETDTTYYWRVDEVGSDGVVETGDVWSFNTRRLVAWWKFDEISGTTVLDSSGNRYHGMVVRGTPLWSGEGKFGGCLDFNVTYGVSIPSGVFRNHIDSEMTLSVWVNGDPNQMDQQNVILQAGAGDTGKPYIISVYTRWRDDGRVDFRTGYDEPDGLRYNAAVQEWAGRWNHYAFVKNANEGFERIYLNGELVAEKTEANATMAGVNIARIGIAPDRFGDQYIGKLDDVRVYSYALSQAEIAEIFNGR